MGVVCLAALGFLIRIGMKANYDQEIRMAAFRRALKAAEVDNGTDQDSLGTLYHYIAARQMPDPNDGFLTLPRGRTEASAFVEWGDRLTMAYGDGDPAIDTSKGRLTQERILVNNNGNEQEFRSEDFQESGTFSDGIGPPVVVTAIPRLIDTYTVTNTAGGTTITQTTGGSVFTGSSAATSDSTCVNTQGACTTVSGGAPGKPIVTW